MEHLPGHAALGHLHMMVPDPESSCLQDASLQLLVLLPSRS